MDSLRNQPDAKMKGWRALFGGDQVTGRAKIFVFLIAFIIIGGFCFAILR